MFNWNKIKECVIVKPVKGNMMGRTDLHLKNDYDHSIHSNPSADDWARFYLKYNPDADLDLIRAWFSNAMMAMHDHLYQTKIRDLENRLEIYESKSND